MIFFSKNPKSEKQNFFFVCVCWGGGGGGGGGGGLARVSEFVLLRIQI